MFRNYSISKTLTRMNMLVSGTALLLACTAFIGYDTATFREASVSSLSIQAQIAGSNAVSALLFDDPDSAEKTLSALQASPTIIAAGILTPDGHPFATYARKKEITPPALPEIPPARDEAYQFEGGNLLLVRRIAFGGKTTGTIYLLSSSERLNARLMLYVEISGIVLVTSLLAALLVSSFFRRAVAEPIIRLAEAARAVSRNKDYSIRVAPGRSRDEISVLVESFNAMLSQIQLRDTALTQAQDQLEQRVQERTHELARINKELESFSYSVSHDLRAPLRSIDGFSQALLEDYADKLGSDATDHLQRVRRAAQHMAALIDEMLNLSRVTRSVMRNEDLDLSAMAKSIAAELREAEPDRCVEFVIEENLTAKGDSHLLHAAISNLLGNSWKYTSGHANARIEFGKTRQNGKNPFFIRDDGAGFDPRYADRLFGVFQRLHTTTEFPGTGVGLATVQRVINRHGGEIWAEGAVEKGATFYFTLEAT